MLIQVIVSYFPYAFVTAFTPGPNNIVALHTISQSGWKKGKNTIFGISCGFLSVMAVCAFFCYELAKYLSPAVAILRYVGAAYILWLAYHVARSKPDGGQSEKTSFWTGFLLQFANVKIIMYALTAYTGYVLPVSASIPYLLIHALCFTVIGVAGTITWAIAGGLLQKFLAKHYRPFNLVMALILVLCAIKLV